MAELSISFPAPFHVLKEANGDVFFCYLNNSEMPHVSTRVPHRFVSLQNAQTFSQSKIISLPPATEQLDELNFVITKSDIAFLS